MQQAVTKQLKTIAFQYYFPEQKQRRFVASHGNYFEANKFDNKKKIFCTISCISF